MADQPKNKSKSKSDTGKPKSHADAGSNAEVAVESSEAYVDFGTTASIRDGASGVVPISELPEPEESPSVVSWAEVIRQQKELAANLAHSSAGDAITVDSISDIDLRRQFGEGLPEPAKQDSLGGTVLFSPFDLQTGSGFSKPGSQESGATSKIDLQSGSVPNFSLTNSSVELGMPHGGGRVDGPTSGNISFTLQSPPSDAGGRFPMPTMPSDMDLKLDRLSTDDLPSFDDTHTDVGQPSRLHDALFGEGDSMHSSIHGGDEADIGFLPDLHQDTPSAAIRSSILDILLTNPNAGSPDGSSSSSHVFGSTPSGVHDNSAVKLDKKRTQPDFTLPETAALVGGSRESLPDVDMPDWLPQDGPVYSENDPTQFASVRPVSGDSGSLDTGDEGDAGSIDLYADRPLESELTASGTFKVSDADMELAKLRAKIMESSAVDLSSTPSFNSFNLADGKRKTPAPDSSSGSASGTFRFGAKKERGAAYAEPVAKYAGDSGVLDMDTPTSTPDFESSMIRRLEEMASQEEFILGEPAMSRKEMESALAAAQITAPLSGGPKSAPHAAVNRHSSKELQAQEAHESSLSVGAAAAASLLPERAKAPYRPAEPSMFPETGARRNRSLAAWLGGGVAGLVLGAGAISGAYFGGLLPKEKEAAQGDNTIAAAKFDDLALRAGKLDEQLKAIAAKVKAKDASGVEAAIAGIVKARDAAVLQQKSSDDRLKETASNLRKAAEENIKLSAAAAKAANELVTFKTDSEKLRNEAAAAKTQLAKLTEEMKAMPKGGDPELQTKFKDAVAKLAAAEAASKKAGDDLKTAQAKSLEANEKLAVAVKEKEQTADLVKKVEAELVKAEAVKPNADAKGIVEGLQKLALRGSTGGEAMKISERKIADLSADLAAGAKKLADLEAKAKTDLADLQKAKDDLQKTALEAKADKEKLASLQKTFDDAKAKLEAEVKEARALASKGTATPQVKVAGLDSEIKAKGNDTSPATGAIFAQRAHANLDLNDIEAARKDAETATKYGATVEGTLALARVMERQGRWAEAERGYRAVLAASGADARLQIEAMLGLGRVLNRVSALPAATGTTGSLTPESALLFMLNLVEFKADGTDEAIALADKLIAAGEYKGHLIKADALAKQKKYAEALKEYSVGIDRIKVLPKEYEGILERILVGLPAVQAIVVKPIHQPVTDVRAADRLFAEGIQAYFANRFTDANDKFSRSIQQFDGDARAFYFRGLSLAALGMTDAAAADYRAGAVLEAKGQPGSKSVNASLERVQGDARAAINSYRP